MTCSFDASGLGGGVGRVTLLLGVGAAVLFGAGACTTGPAQPTGDETGGPRVELIDDPRVTALAVELYEDRALQAAVGQVIEDGEVVAEFALGEAQSGVPATIDDSFRNGAVAIAYLGIATLRLDERNVIDIDAPIAEYLPDLPDADLITPRQLISMTSGIPDYVPDPDFVAASTADPFRMWTAEELIEYGISQPRLFAPGENWDYSHTGVVLLGEVLARAADMPLAEILRGEVLEPAGLTNTFSEQTARIPDPVLHAYTAERGLYEDSTFWNPSWTLAEGAVQTTTIGDAAHSFDAIIGRGELLEPASYEALISKDLVGFGSVLPGCRNCHTLDDAYAYGLGVALRGDYVAQNPLFGGYAASVITLPEGNARDGRSLTVSVAVTLREDAVADWQDAIANRADELAIAIATELRPEQAPPAFVGSRE